MSDKELNINIRTTADTSGADQTAEAINKTREAAQGAGESADAIDQVTTALNNAKTAAKETGTAMNEGIGPEQERALENARTKLDEYADALTAAGSRMKAAFDDNPGLTGFIDEVTNGVLTSEEFRKKLEQVDDVFEVLNDRASNLDLGAKWGDGLDENLQKIIDDYNKEIDAADKAADKAEDAEARKQKAAASTVERLEAGNRRASATYEELQAELEAYIAKLEEARKAGDNVAQADALKNIQDLGRRIKTAGEAGELTTTQVKGMAGQITIAATRILGMSSSLRGAIPFIHLFGTTIKTAMGPLGWAMLLIQGLTAGISALIDHFKAKSDELERQAEEKKKNMEKLIKEANELKAELNNETVLQTENAITAKIADNRKIETEALRESVREQQRLIDLQSKILDEQDRARLLDAETDFYNGKYGDPNSSEVRRKLERVQEGIRMDANARHRAESEEVAQSNVRNSEGELLKARKSVEQLKARIAELENSPVLSLNELKQVEGEIAKIENGEKLTFADWEKLYAARKKRDASDQALKEEGYDLSTKASRDDAYKANDDTLKKAREDQAKAVEAQHKAEDELGKATQQLADRRALNAAQDRRDVAQQRNTEAKHKNAEKKEEEDRMQKAVEAQLREQEEQLKKKIREQEKAEKEQKQKYKESLKNPDLSRTGQKKEVKNALGNVSKELAPEIQKAMADGKLSAEESQALSRQFIEAVKAQGIAYNRNLKTLTSYFQETLNVVQRQAKDADQAQKTTESLKTQLEALKKQVITIQRQRRNSGH
ncbi:hypothetical protein ACAZ27_00395 [Akkermansia muciniphila]|jgi:hypothetical protein|nr:hypothetical protein CXU18_00390 [Akkermansia muciniphila]PNC48422.1 hypothetical protein CXU11_08240 [Akkermansia muciniphila]PNC51739.1 hypothetical protein CXU15_04535 [Akkermansia muciniphila]DAJ78809.1 MAG TPA: MAEBL protein [Caudoviricetes sp.]